MTEKALFHKKGVLVVKNEVGQYQAVDSIIKEIDLEIEIREAEMARTTDADLIKGLKSMIYEFEREKKEASEIDHRAHIYFPVVMKEKMLYYNNSDGHNNFLHPGKMCIRDFTTFPSKPYLISRFDWFLKYYYEEGYRATIYDQEDKEISIEELIDRSYQKPEDYFTAKRPTDPPDNLGCNQGQDFYSTSEGISNNNISETPETGSSCSESVENMQNLDSPDDENEKKLLCQGALLQYNISESQIIENPAKSYSDYLVDGDTYMAT